MKKYLMIKALGFLVMLSVCGHAQIAAFPGAEGFGAHAAGGRGGDVYIVKNLNSSGAGSFAEGIATAPASGRTIVFAVSGYIPISGSYLDLTKSKITIAGQTAPGDGIGLRNAAFRIFGDDIVIRHVRFRHGKNGTGGDCVNLSETTSNCMLDHIAMQFSTDENMSSFNSPPDNLTLQWSLNAWGLDPHSAGGLWYVNRATTHHSLWAHNHTRDPKAVPTGLLDWVNNVTLDYGIGFILADSTETANYKANVENCYFICPPGNTRPYALSRSGVDATGKPNFSLWLANCLWDNDGDSLLDGYDRGTGILSVTPGSLNLATSAFARTSGLPVAQDPALVAYKKIVSQAGPLRLDVGYGGPLRDEVDTRLLNNLTSLAANQIASETELTGVSGNGFGTLNSAPGLLDRDKDGMPDAYEDALGWSKATQDHNTALASSGGVLTGTTFYPPGTVAGYTRLEEYLYFKSIPHGVVAQNTSGSPTSIVVNMAKFTSGFAQSPSFTVSQVNGGTVALGGAGNSIATFTPTPNTSGRARFDFTVTDAAGHSWTQTCAILVTVGVSPRDLVWKGTGNGWDGSTPNWLKPADGLTVAFAAGDRVVFDQTGIAQPNVGITGTVEPGGIEVNATGSYTFSGNGTIASSGELVKRGSGTLTLAGPTIYSGTTRIEAGTLRVGPASGASTTATLIESPGIINAGTLVFRRTDSTDVDLAGPVSGGGAVIYEGSGVSNQSRYHANDANSYSGGTTINQSRVALSQATGLGSGPVVITAGGQIFNNATLTITNPITLAGNGWIESAGALGALRINNGSVLSGPITLAGNARICASSGTATFSGGISGPFALELGEDNTTGTVMLSGANTHSGDTTVSFGTLNLAAAGSLRFAPGANGICNKITGTGSATFNGTFLIDTANAALANGNSWTLVNVATLAESFGGTFNIPGFTESANVWTRSAGPVTWTFSEATGVLSLAVNAPILTLTAPASEPVTVPLSGNALHLSATVAPGGPTGPLNWSWTVLSGPASASFDNPAAASPIVSFTNPGTYVIQVAATVGIPPATVSSTATRTVIVAPPGDFALRQGVNGYSHTATFIRGDTTTWNSGARDQLLIGRTTANLRGVFSFDLASVPVGFVVRSAALDVWTASGGGSGSVPLSINLHRLNLVPTEGTGLGIVSTDGTLTGTTWVRRTNSVENINWLVPGGGSGDYVNTALATASGISPAALNTQATFASTALADAANAARTAGQPLSLIAISSNETTANLFARLHSDDSTDTSRRPCLTLGFSANAAPAVAPGAAPTAYAAHPANLSGSTTGASSNLWSLISGPGPVSFTNASMPATTATFATAGAYLLRLTSANTHGTTSQTLAVSVAPPLSAQEQWRLTHFGTPANTGTAADSYDANGDGELNLMEFATGQNPHAATRAQIQIVLAAGQIEFTYTRSKAAFDEGCLFNVEYSDTLAAGDWASVGEGAIVTDNGIMQTLKATIPAGPGTKRFARLRVNDP